MHEQKKTDPANAGREAQSKQTQEQYLPLVLLLVPTYNL
jgi:hypothetical protein